jgi:hypothetical protein
MRCAKQDQDKNNSRMSEGWRIQHNREHRGEDADREALGVWPCHDTGHHKRWNTDSKDGWRRMASAVQQRCMYLKDREKAAKNRINAQTLVARRCL